MTKWDALLVNAVGAILVDMIPTPSQLEVDLYMIRMAVPKVSADNPRMVRLAGHAGAMAENATRRGSREWASARFGAESALADILRWRAAQVHDQLKGEAR